MLDTDREINTSHTGKRTSLVGLPPEIRDMIYHYHLTSKKIEPRHVTLTKRWTPIDLLYVNKTIYEESFFHLYTRGDFVLEVRPEQICGLATRCGTMYPNATVGLEMFAKNPKIAESIRHISLEIHWPSIEYCKLIDRLSRAQEPSMDVLLKKAMAMLGAILSGLPGLRTIEVSWICRPVCAPECPRAEPPKYKILPWLRSLKQVRRENEKVLIRMPLQGSISTEELAQEQKDMSEIMTKLREIREDLEELQGCLRDDYY